MQTRPSGRAPFACLRFPEPAYASQFLRGVALASIASWALLVAASISPPRPVSPPAPVGDATPRIHHHPTDGLSAFIASPPVPALEHAVTDQDVRQAVREAVIWIVRHQFPEGCWDPDRFYVCCAGTPCDGRGKGDHETGVTAIATLALLRSGSCNFAAPIDREGLVTRSARRGLDWLVRAQGVDGTVGNPDGPKFLYGHALATLALCEGFLWSGDARYRAAARKAVRVLESARSPAGGWRYGLRDGEADTSVTGWAVAACLAADRIGVVPYPDFASAARRWIERVTDPLDFRVGYTRRGTAGSALPGVNDRFAANETCTAIGIAVRRAAGASASDPAVREGVRRLARDLPRWAEGQVDYYYWYHGTQALAAIEGPDAPCRRAWSAAVARVLVSHQVWDAEDRAPGGCSRGSWDPTDKWGSEGGRVCATALNALTLQALLEND